MSYLISVAQIFLKLIKIVRVGAKIVKSRVGKPEHNFFFLGGGGGLVVKWHVPHIQSVLEKPGHARFAEVKTERRIISIS